MTTSQRPVGRPPRITREAIVEVAKQIVEREGVDRLTMRRIATEVGATPMALYHHVRDKDGLLILLMEDAAATIPRPRLPADPRGRVVALFRRLHETFASRPWIVDVLASDDLMHVEGLWYVEHILDALARAGLDAEQAVQAYRQLWTFTVGDIVIRRSAEHRRATSDRPNLRDRLLGGVDASTYPRLAEVGPCWASLTARDGYRDGLEALLTGILSSSAVPTRPG